MDKQKERLSRLLEGTGMEYPEVVANYLCTQGVIAPPIRIGSIVYAFVNGKINVFIVNRIEMCVEIEKQSATYYGIGNASECPAIKFVDKNIGVGVFLTLDEANKAMEIDDGTT